MAQLTNDEKFLLQVLKDHGNQMGYKELNEICSEKFEGVRLILKKLKNLGIIDYEGSIPMFNSVIKLYKFADE
jgi:hypothetical protein